MTEVRPAVHPSAGALILDVESQTTAAACCLVGQEQKNSPTLYWTTGAVEFEEQNKSLPSRRTDSTLYTNYTRMGVLWHRAPIITVQQFHLTASGPKCNSLLLMAHTRMMMAQRKLLFEWWRKWERSCYIFMVFSFCTLKVNGDHLLIVPTCLRVLGNKEDSCIKYRKRRGKTWALGRHLLLLVLCPKLSRRSTFRNIPWIGYWTVDVNKTRIHYERPQE